MVKSPPPPPEHLILQLTAASCVPIKKLGRRKEGLGCGGGQDSQSKRKSHISAAVSFLNGEGWTCGLHSYLSASGGKER